MVFAANRAIRRYCLFADAFLRSAQYFFIRADTAFFCAADILDRLRLEGLVCEAAGDFPLLRARPRVSWPRSGKVFTSDATSAWSSCQRASAPRRAHLRMSCECFAITRHVT